MFQIFQDDQYDDSTYYVYLVLVAATALVIVIHVYNIRSICSCLFLCFRISIIDWKGGSRGGRMHILSFTSLVLPICANIQYWNVPWGWITFGKRILTQFFVKCQSQNLGPLQPQSLLGSCWEGFGIAAWSTVKIKNISGMIVTCISSWKGLRHGSISSLFWLWECFSSICTLVFCWIIFWEGHLTSHQKKQVTARF